MKSEQQKISSGRAVLVTEARGSGAPVIFMHSGICDRRMWRAQMDSIGNGNKAIAYDRRGFGETHAENEDFSAVEDLMAVADAMVDGAPVVLVGCSEGGRIALDAVLRHPSRVRALVLIAPSVTGAPEASYSREMKDVMTRLMEAQKAGDLDLVNDIKARLFLDGALAQENRVTGQTRRLFLDMNSIALRSPPIGTNLDVAPAYPRLSEVSVPTLVISGDLDFPHIQQRCRYVAETVADGSLRSLAGAAHLPSLERPAEVTDLLTGFIATCSNQ